MVPPDDAANGDELPRGALQGRARPHLVGREGDQGPRNRHACDPRRVLPRCRAAAGGARPSVGPARVPHHAARHGARHELRDQDGRPLGGRWTEERAGDRGPGAGAGTSQWASVVRVAEPRPCFDRGDTRGLHGSPARLLPRELDRPQQRWRLSRLGAKHVGRLQSQQEDGQGAVAARRQTERLRDGAGDGVRVAARRTTSGPRANQHLRRRRRAAGGPAVTGTRPATRRRPRGGHASYANTPTGPAGSSRASWATRRSSTTGTCSSAGGASRT